MRKQGKICCELALEVLVCAILGLALLMIVYLLPTNRIRMHVIESKQTLENLSDDDAVTFSEWCDTNTNIIMLHEAIFRSNDKSVLYDALCAPTWNYMSEWTGRWEQSLTRVADDSSEMYADVITYPRYWHGQIILLKPLLEVMNLQEIYALNAAVQIILILLVLYWMLKKLGKYTIAYAVMLISMKWIFIAQSIQLSVIFYITNIIVLLLLLAADNNGYDYYIKIMCLDGIMVAYFDFLTYPAYAACVPILVFVLLHNEGKVWMTIKDCIFGGLSFLWGYAGMWASKWVMATVLTDENIIKDAYDSVLHRVGAGQISDTEKAATPGVSLLFNARACFEKPILLLLILGMIIIICMIIRNRGIRRVDKSVITASTIVSVVILAWYVIVYNHCSLHPHLEWREYTAIIFAVGCLGLSLLPDER